MLFWHSRQGSVLAVGTAALQGPTFCYLLAPKFSEGAVCVPRDPWCRTRPRTGHCAPQRCRGGTQASTTPTWPFRVKVRVSVFHFSPARDATHKSDGVVLSVQDLTILYNY